MDPIGSKVLWKWDVKKILNQWKGGQLDWKLSRKFIQRCQNALNLLNNTFWWNIRPTLDPTISGTTCDSAKLIFSAERGGQTDCVGV